MKLRKLFSLLCAIALVVSAMSVMAFAANDDFGGENLYYAVKVPEGQTITPDGVKDAAYDSTQALAVNTLMPWGDQNQPTEATAYVMWDDEFMYVFAEVTDSTHYGWEEGAWTEWNDCFEFYFDLLHDDKYSAEGWTGGWGEQYRGGVMCEAHYKINAGITELFPDQRFGNGNETTWEWLSNATTNDGVSCGISKLTDTGYTVEYKIKTTFNEVPAELRLHDGQEIGFGIKLYDSHREDGQQNAIYVMEGINDGMGGGPKALSDMILVNALPSDDEPADDGVVLFEGEKLLETNWAWDGMPLDFTADCEIVEGSYLTVTYSGANPDAVYIVLEAPSTWVEGSENHYVQIEHADSCVDNGDGTYTVTFTYDQIEAANAEKNMDYSKVEKLRVGGNNDGAGITVTNVTWHLPTAEPVGPPVPTEPEATEPEATEPEATEPEATEPEATEPEATEPEATEPEATEPYRPEVKVNVFNGTHDPLVNGSADDGVRIVSKEHEGTTDPFDCVFDPTVMVSGGYFTVSYTGPEGAARIQLKDDIAWTYVTVEPRTTVQNGDGWTSYFYYDDIVSDYDFTTDLYMLFACASWDVTADTPVVITDVTWVTPGSGTPSTGDSAVIVAAAAALVTAMGAVAIVTKRRFAV